MDFTPPTPPTPLLVRLRKTQTAGKSVLQDLTKIFPRNEYLQRVISILIALYGPKAEIVQKYRDAIKNARSISTDDLIGLFTEFDHLVNSLDSFSIQDIINPSSHASLPPSGQNVFIIHGHDEVNTLRLRVLLQDHFHLSPVLMKKEAGMSRALLTKFEDVASSCAIAFALMTPDDQILNGTSQYFQARPNVIFETGWFAGRLGVPRVCILLKDGTEVHSDIDGISRLSFKDNVDERLIEIERELKAVKIIR